MLFLSLKDFSFTQIIHASHCKDLVQGFELRVTKADDHTIEQLAKARTLLKTHLILFAWKGRLEERSLRMLLRLGPDYVDVDYRIDEGLYHRLREDFPDVKWVLSYHNFELTEACLERRLADMQTKEAEIYKLAMYATSGIDTLRMLKFVKEQDGNVTGLCMGEFGVSSRILAPVVGSAMNYACLPGKSVAPGQLDLGELLRTFHYQQLNSDSEMYCLFGDPVNLSFSHITHNAVMQRLGLNAVYVKFVVKKGELATAVSLAQSVGFKGLSITAPLKVEAYHLFGEGVEERAVNTIDLAAGPVGSNTDGMAVERLLSRKMPLAGASVLLIGAGGMARAIACRLKSAGCLIEVQNRSTNTRDDLCQMFGLSVAQGGKDYHCVIQAASGDSGFAKMDCNVALEVISNPFWTPFLDAYQNSELILGVEVFIEQAILQFATWFSEMDVNRIEIEMKEVTSGLCDKLNFSLQKIKKTHNLST